MSDSGRHARPPTRVLLARYQDIAVVRFEGPGNMQVAPALQALLEDVRAAGTQAVYVDLARCTGMDSTFMGLLVGQAQAFAGIGGRLAVVSPSELCVRLLRQLGVDQVVAVIAEATTPEVAFVEVPARIAVPAERRAALIRQAHQALIALSEENRARFSAFLEALDADLRRRGER
ncbi:MAG: STAS domain-containing protein [Planctomycetota bacterium]|nr:STAS domain-containing protein [Planctomycetota bacterium]MCX8039164.1 STAS domain-containing protein [Planctomycetota bacterium]MDW8372138.1 STAS domain-containing protein [Planctomycetota bacterium]